MTRRVVVGNRSPLRAIDLPMLVATQGPRSNASCTLSYVELLERHTHLAELEAALRDAAAGRGSVVLVTGEAGAGKTALVEQFVTSPPVESRVLAGLCDDLRTPRPLGPFRDMTEQVGGDLRRVIETASVEGLPDALLQELTRPPHPVVMVVEDAHWGDEATLDAVRFLGRRIEGFQALLLVTYRDDEVPADHPLRLALGAIPAANLRRVRLGSLSPRAVARLAGRSDIDDLYELTGGNAFYVSEVLAAPSGEVPHTVQDAVMARVARLGGKGRECVETASVVPTRAEMWLLDESGASAGIDEAERLGVLRVNVDAVSFTHELARRAVERSLSVNRRREINRLVLDLLIEKDADLARLAHHAAESQDSAVVARFAPAAARRAASLESHREAVAHYEQALGHSDRFSEEGLGDLLEEYARECYLSGHHDRARSALLRSVEIHGEKSDLERLGVNLTLLSDVHWFLGEGKEAESASIKAIDTLEGQPPGRALARAYSQRAKLAIEDRRADEAILWGERAVELARRLDDSDVLVHSLNVVGSARWMIPPFDNALLVESLALAREKGLAQAVGRAYANLADGYIHVMDYARASPYLEEGVRFCEEHDLVTGCNILLAGRGIWHLEQGRWSEADRDVRRPVASGDVSRISALWVIGLIMARRGDPNARSVLEEAHEHAKRSGESRNLVPLALARAELAWLGDDLVAASKAASPVLGIALESRSPRWIGETALWLHRAGALDEVPSAAAEPYVLQIEGRWREAAARWATLGRPYEEADALGDAPEPEPLLAALPILDRLGAVPRAGKVRRRLGEMGVPRVPRGPTEAARSSPAGLTARQTEVLRLLAEGLTYRQIGERLHLSAKTVDHHVSAVRLKLEVRTRSDAVEAGRRLGILPAEDGEPTRPT